MSISLSESVSLNGLGIMSLTAKLVPVSKNVAFDAILKAIELNLPEKTLINGGEFYGPNFINLEYLKEFFEKYPEQRKHAVVSVKGAFNIQTFQATLDKAGIDASIDNILKYVPDLDIFEPARITPGFDKFEELVGALDDAIESGRIKGFTLSEVGAKTLETVSKLTKHKVLGVEVEFSLFSRQIIDNGLAAKAKELDVPIIAYSPLSRGILTGALKSVDDIPEGDLRRRFERFSKENIGANLKTVEYLEKLAKKKNVTPSQLALDWVKYHSEKTINGVSFPKVIPIASSSSVQRVEENFTTGGLTDEEFEDINSHFKNNPALGGRYNSAVDFLLEG